MGRKPAELDLERIEKLASIGCTVAEIAEIERVDKKTLERHCLDVINQGRAKLTTSIKRAQVRKALDGDNTMLIWTGKQYCGQRDNVDLTADVRQTYYISGEPIKDRANNVIDLDPDQWALHHKPKP